MASHNAASQTTDSSAPKLLAVSFAFPPLAYPRSIQVARLVKYLRLPTVLVCADERGARLDPTLEPDAEAALLKCLRVPFNVSKLKRYANIAAYRLRRPLWNSWNRAPDQYRAWMPAALDAVESFVRDTRFIPDVLATFSQPATDHLVGLELKERYRLPWIAHFSDPWVDNPFYTYDAATRRVNSELERRVVESADRLVFTSQETVDLVMSKYPPAWKSKALALPQSFDPALYPPPSSESETGLTVRHLGNFYVHRTPAPLLRALQSILSSAPSVLRDVRFELIGVTDAQIVKDAGLESLPEGLVVVRPPVGYRESLALMSQSDGLVVIDAPSDESVFLPSKLVDYIGASRPILGLTPQGTAAKLIAQLGGWRADPSDTEAVAAALENFLTALRERKSERSVAWGEPSVRRRYEAPHLASLFAEIVKELLA